MENQLEKERADFGLEKKSKITLKAVWGKQQGQLILCPVRDRVTNRMKGVKTYSPEEARHRVRVVDENTSRIISDGLVLNLEDEVDAVDWAWIQECKEVAKSLDEAQMSQSALFYVEDLDREVIDRVRLEDIRYEAKTFIKNSSEFRKAEITRLLGRDPKYMRPIDIVDYLNDLAFNKPQLVVNTYEDKEYKTKLFLLNLVDARIVHKDANGFFKYEGIVIGVNDAAAIQWLKDPNNATVVRQFHLMLNPDMANQSYKPDEPKTEEPPAETIVHESEVTDEDANESDTVHQYPITEDEAFKADDAPKQSFEVVQASPGWFNVVDQDGNVQNDNKLRKAAAEQLMASLSE